MRLLLLIGVVTVCTTFIESVVGECFYAEDVCPSKYITFWLRTRKTGYDGILITEENLDKIPLVNGPLIVIIHGYKGNKDRIPNPQLVTAYLKKGDYNIITVDWGEMAMEPCYLTAAPNTRVAGKCTARLLERLYSKRGQQWKQATHVVGFSLGAHVAGVLGNHLPGLPRITGIDPALPGFSESLSDQERRLDPTDALFVDSYHSNGGERGRVSPLGHVDFYINNGKSQPLCDSASCSHHRAVEVYAESINNPDGFYGLPCNPKVLSSIVGMSKEICPYNGNKNSVRAGEYVSDKARGTYKFETNASPPYARGKARKRRNIKMT